MGLVEFRDKLKIYRQLSGRTQQELAEKIGMQPAVLSHKLAHTARYVLRLEDVRQLIMTLVEWKGITTRSQVFELLELLDLQASTFAEKEWDNQPLNWLYSSELNTSAVISTTKLSSSTGFSTTKLPSNFATPYTDGNLPLQSTPLIGRREELGYICRMLGCTSVRLLTLSGPGGVGKTRLAIQTLVELWSDFSDGGRFVTLANLNNLAQIADTISRSFEIKITNPATVIETLKRGLQGRHLLLVLDNFEHLISSQALKFLLDLLNSLPELKLLVTSRILLRCYGEHEFAVPPLNLPKLNPKKALLPTPKVLAKYDAVALFIARACAANSFFRLTPENSQYIIQICHRLDCLPLAIELAAARVKTLSLPAILERINSSANFLKSGLYNQPDRQQTLQATLTWSYNLLEPIEQKLFCWLTIFKSSFSLLAIETICGPLLADETELSVQELLESLVNKSLVQQIIQNNDHNPKSIRFKLLVTVRECALTLTQSSTDQNQIYLNFINYYLSITEGGLAYLSGPEQIKWLDELEVEYSNLLAALHIALQPEKPQIVIQNTNLEIGLRLAAGLRPLWIYRGYREDAKFWAELILGLLAEYDGPKSNLFISAYADIYYTAGMVQHEQTNYSAARPFYEKALSLYRECNNTQWVAATLNNLGYLAYKEGDYPKARAILNESKKLYEALAKKTYSTRGLLTVLNYLAIISMSENDLEEAQVLYEQALPATRELGINLSLAVMLNNFGELLIMRGSYKRAEECLQEGLALMREMGHKKNIAVLLCTLGILTYYQASYSQAREYFAESLDLCEELEHRVTIVENLIGLAAVTFAEGGAVQAAELLAAAIVMQNSLGIIFSPVIKIIYEQLLPQIQAQLDATTFNSAWRIGNLLPLVEVLKRNLPNSSEKSTPSSISLSQEDTADGDLTYE